MMEAPARPITTKVLFLPGLSLGRSQKQKELDRAEALRHASVEAHRRRRRRASQGVVLLPATVAAVAAAAAASPSADLPGGDGERGLRQRRRNSEKTQRTATTTLAPPVLRPEPAATAAVRRQQEAELPVPRFKGNTDPFHSLAVAMTPRVGEILCFARTYFVPGIFGVQPCLHSNSNSGSGSGSSNCTVSSSRRQGTTIQGSGAVATATDNHDDHDADQGPETPGGLFSDVEFTTGVPMVLQDECRALCFLLTYLTAMSRLTPSEVLVQEVHNLRHRAFHTLRRRITPRGQQQPQCDSTASGSSSTATMLDTNKILMFSTVSLFGAAVLAHDLEEATMHGRVVRAQFRLPANIPHANLLIRTLYKDAMLATTFMVPTLFDVTPEGWVEATLAPHFVSLQPMLLGIRPVVRAMGWQRGGEELVGKQVTELFAAAREAHWLWCTPAHGGRLKPLCYAWVFARHLLLQCRCVNMMAALRIQYGVDWEESNSNPVWTPDQGYERRARVAPWLQATLAAALMALMTLSRAGGGVEQMCFCGVEDVAGMMEVLFARTLGIVSEVDGRGKESDDSLQTESVTEDIVANDTDAPLLWAAFIGLLIEFNAATASFTGGRRTSAAAGRTFAFSPLLQAKIRAMGLRDWDAVEDVLEGFVYPEGLVPGGLKRAAFPSTGG